MPLTLPKISRTGTTPSRKRFWDNARETLLGLQKVAGRHVTVDEHKGKGSIINIEDTAGRRGGTFVPTGACCTDGDCTISTASDCIDGGGNYLGNGTDCDGIDCTHGACCDAGDCSLTTEGDCTGDFQGYGTTCDPNPCGGGEPNGACCVDTDCSTQTESQCSDLGGVYLGDDTNCDNPATCACPCSWAAFDGSSQYYLKQTRTLTFNENNSADGFGGCTCNSTEDATWDEEYDEFCNATCSCSGSASRNSDAHHVIDCSASLSTCVDGFDPYNYASFVGTPDQAIGCVGDCGTCCAYTLSLETDTPTERTFSFVSTGGCCEGTGTLVVTLSNPCLPG